MVWVFSVMRFFMGEGQKIKRIRLLLAWAALIVTSATAMLAGWQTAVVHAVVAGIWLSLLFTRSHRKNVFFWLFLTDIFFLSYDGIGRAYLSENHLFALICLSALLLLLACALSERVPAVFSAPEPPQMPRLLLIAVPGLTLVLLVYVFFIVPYLLHLKTSEPLLGFAGIAASEGVRLLPVQFSGEFDTLPYYAIALSSSALLLGISGVASVQFRVFANSIRTPLLPGIFVLALGVLAVVRLGSYAVEYLQLEKVDPRTFCEGGAVSGEITYPPGTLIEKAVVLSDFNRLAELLEWRARSARLAGKPLEAVSDYARLVGLFPFSGRHVVGLAAALSEAGLRNDGLRLALRMIDSGDELRDFDACLPDDYEMLVDLWMRYGGEREQMDALRSLAPKEGEEYRGDKMSRRHALLMRYASLCAYAGKPEESRRVAALALKRSPYDAGALNAMGEAAYSEEKFYEALDYFDQAVSLEPGNYLYVFNLLSVAALNDDRELISSMQGRLMQEYEPSHWRGTANGDFEKSGRAELEIVMLPGWSQFGVMVRGNKIDGKFPQFSIEINGEPCGDFTLLSESETPYTCEFYALRGINNVRFVYKGVSSEATMSPPGLSMARPIFWPYEIRWR